MLRYEMRRSKFEKVIKELLDEGRVYGGYSAGALVAGISVAGVERVDDPSYANELVEEGLGLVPFVILPHVDDPEFADITPIFKDRHRDKSIILLKDSQAVVFNDTEHMVTDVV